MFKRLFYTPLLLLSFTSLSMEQSDAKTESLLAFQNQSPDSLTKKCILKIASLILHKPINLTPLPPELYSEIINLALYQHPSHYWDSKNDFSTINDDQWDLKGKPYALSPNHEFLVSLSNGTLELYDVRLKQLLYSKDIRWVNEHIELQKPVLLAIGNSGNYISILGEEKYDGGKLVIIFHLNKSGSQSVRTQFKEVIEMGIDEENSRLIINTGSNIQNYNLYTLTPLSTVPQIRLGSQPFLETILDTQIRYNFSSYLPQEHKPQTVLALLKGSNSLAITVDSEVSSYDCFYIWNLHREEWPIIRQCNFRPTSTQPRASISPDYKTIFILTEEGPISVTLDLRKSTKDSS